MHEPKTAKAVLEPPGDGLKNRSNTDVASDADLDNRRPLDFQEHRAPAVDGGRDGARRGLPMYRIDDPDDDFARNCVLGGFLSLRETLLLIAPPFTGKSVLLAHMAWHLATARPWFGHAINEAAPVLIIAAERHREMKRRLNALAHELPSDKPAMIMIANGRGLDLRQKEKAIGVLKDTAKEFMSIFGSPPSIVIFDTLSKMMPGSDEVKSADMTIAMAVIEEVRDQFGFNAIVVHHTPRDNPPPTLTELHGLGAVRDWRLAVVRDLKDSRSG